MTYQDQLIVSLLTLSLAKQGYALTEMDALLHDLMARMNLAGDQHRHADNCFAEQGKALEQMNAQLLSLSERVDEGASQRRSTNMTFGIATACLIQHREGLEQVGAVVRDLMDRVAAMELQQRQAARAARVQGTPTKPTIKLERAAATRRIERKKPFSRPGASGRA